MSKIYVLQLIGDIQSTPGSVTLKLGGVSLNRNALETLKVRKDKELDEYMGDDGCDYNEEDEDGVTYLNYDLTSRPVWEITEHDMV